MNQTEQTLRNFWQALPDSAPFNSFFDAEIVSVQSADREIERAEAALAAAKARKAEELSTLARYVELAAKREWTQEQIDAAKGAAK